MIDVPQWLLPHAELLFGVSLWVNIALGLIVLALLGFVWRSYKWAATKLLQRLDAQDDVMEEIKHLVTAEINLLKNAQHQAEVRLAILEEFKEQMQNRFHNYGRRITDKKFEDDVPR